MPGLQLEGGGVPRGAGTVFEADGLDTGHVVSCSFPICCCCSLLTVVPLHTVCVKNQLDSMDTLTPRGSSHP